MSGDTHFHPLRIAEYRPEAEDALVLGFDVPDSLRDAFAFEPGQHLTLRHTLNGEEQRRSYSICSGTDPARLQVGIRHVPGGLFSSWVHAELKAGETIDVMPPQGRFTFRPDPQARRHVLLIAGGSGITPILAILRSLLAQEPHSHATLIYGNRSGASTMFKEELEDLKNRHLTRLAIHPVFSREPVDAPLSSGRIDRDKLAVFLRTLIDVQGIDAAYVCGPYGLNDEAEAALRDAGLAPGRIHIERFGVPDGAAPLPVAQAGDVAQAQITIVRDGFTRVVPFAESDGHILQAAARAGMDVPYSCKSGVCGTCRARLQAGEVRMDRNFALEPADLAAGFVLTCQAHPLTPAVTVSFDDR
ncbi:1,2-phenylacetyl-CoA epoxidase subunit PaaE [Aquabacterium sp.]|uniref:1,2-phenylacetyl-CoA epoxidase subunit PaaE n=1 Tax=Aquabacterium sp. TaxID=1872578 RepID=UPI002CB172AC|nr:1,2-phenylacetyl-CoA epoxidase subunit PaaE [Aquabacterium sp.]HSW06183.1 1,2-phenylacetyl-CoA epoxidase subunit PaaE [Aquabacterium sp.]